MTSPEVVSTVNCDCGFGSLGEEDEVQKVGIEEVDYAALADQTDWISASDIRAILVTILPFLHSDSDSVQDIQQFLHERVVQLSSRKCLPYLWT